MTQRETILRLAAALAAILPSMLAAQTGGSTQDPAPQPQASLEERLRALEARLDAKDGEMQALEKKLAAKSEATKWYDKLSIRGYGQIRYTTLYNENNTPNLSVPNDRSVNEAETLLLRRGRVILSGDVTDRLFVYAQSDFAGSVTSGADSAVQMRDFYGDIAIDADKEHRFRLGQSKVPFGWVNLQSSQNRAPIERPDALNSAFEGERDMGAYYYWAPKHIRDLFRDLVRSGRKGSGDYGVLGIGAFAGQGPNRSDQNGEVHWVARASYPFEFENKQVVELGVQAYTGEFVVATTPAVGGIPATASADGVRDERLGATFVLYPQPFGLEAEWNWGRGPQLRDDLTAIEEEWLQGGYVQANYMWKTESGVFFPFARWNYFDGGRKFARFAPKDEVNEIDVGIEYSPVPEVEITMMYTHTFWRTDTTDLTAPFFQEARDDDRIGIQVQVNF